MVAAGEDATQAENDDEKKSSAKREAQGRSRWVHVGWRKILTLHHNCLFLILHSYIVGKEEEKEEEEEANLQSENECAEMRRREDCIFIEKGFKAQRDERRD